MHALHFRLRHGLLVASFAACSAVAPTRNYTLAPPYRGGEAMAMPMADMPESREQYAHRAETGFRTPGAEPYSTFSIDVDTAAYANVRRFLMQNQALPPADAVKLEELVNYFDYDYEPPQGGEAFSIQTEVGEAPWQPAHRLVHIGLQGKQIAAESLPPSHLTFLLDVSGSMDEPNKLPLVKTALRLLVEQLRPTDRVAIVVYAGASGLVLDSTSDRNAILDALERLSAGGSTAGADGIQLAYSVASKHFIPGGNNRVILATDGDFNVGMSSDGELVRLIESKRKTGIFLTVLGFGTGNYQDAKMEQLADHGNGNHAYIDSAFEARKVLVSEMGGTLLTIAKDVKIQVEFNPSQVKAYRLLGYENRRLAAQEFNDDQKDAGDLGAGHSVTALYEIIPADSSEPVAGADPLKYQAPRSVPAQAGELATIKLRYKQPTSETSQLMTRVIEDHKQPLAKTSNDFRFAGAVAEFAMLLRRSEFAGMGTFAHVRAAAAQSLGTDPRGYRAEFLQLVDRAIALTGAQLAR